MRASTASTSCWRPAAGATAGLGAGGNGGRAGGRGAAAAPARQLPNPMAAMRGGRRGAAREAARRSRVPSAERLLGSDAAEGQGKPAPRAEGAGNILPIAHRQLAVQADAAGNVVQEEGQQGASPQQQEGQQQPAAPQAAAADSAADVANAERAGGSSATSPAPIPAALAAAEEAAGLHRPVGIVVGSAWLLATSVQLTGAAALTPLWLPAMAGGLLGGLYSLARYHWGPRRLWRAPRAPLRVVVTGGSAGIGKALAREFLRSGDHVVITSRSSEGAARAAQQLREEVGPAACVTGVECNVSDPASVERLVQAAAAQLGGIDCMINNAGYSGSFKSLIHQTPEQIDQVVRTNLLGSLLATRAAMKSMADQPGGGHIFNMEGAGADGSATPQYAAYGATKAALGQLLRTLQHEAAALPGAGGPVRVHNLSPGMVLTELLLEGATLQNKQVFNILCEHPETVAAFLVPRARSVVAAGRRGAAIRYLTPMRVLSKFLLAPVRGRRYFDAEGRPLYLPERERILGGHARVTQRLQARAARRSGPLQLAYSVAMALSFLLIVSDALAKAPPPGMH